jgi:hypothetical protein
MVRRTRDELLDDDPITLKEASELLLCGIGAAMKALRSPRFMTDADLCRYFGLSERTLMRLRATSTFPKKDEMISRTDRRAVELFFDRRAGIPSPSFAPAVDGKENFDD